MTFLSGTDYFGVFRIHDARTGEIPPVLAEGEQGIYLTPDVAENCSVKSIRRTNGYIGETVPVNLR